MNTKKWYLAGPLFNPVQVDLLEKIEATFAAADVPLFSPRLCDENKVKGPLSSDSAARIFSRNWEALLDSRGMLAVVDWLLPKGQEIRQTGKFTVADPKAADYLTNYPELRFCQSGPLNIPDSGTVWELGATYALRSKYGPHGKAGPITPLPVLLFTVRPPNQKLNIMLSQGTDGVIYGLNNLKGYLNGGPKQFTFISKWEGENL